MGDVVVGEIWRIQQYKQTNNKKVNKKHHILNNSEFLGKCPPKQYQYKVKKTRHKLPTYNVHKI